MPACWSGSGPCSRGSSLPPTQAGLQHPDGLCLALAFDLLPDSQRAAAARRLAQDVDRFKHITTGFLGTPVICQVLSDYGYLDQAYMLLNRKDYPSWLYPITRGATTIWERWDGIKVGRQLPGRGHELLQPLCVRAIGQWLYGVVAGIDLDPEQPGYRHVLIRPQPGGGLSFAKASLDSMFGTIRSAWQVNDGRMQIDVAIPPNASPRPSHCPMPRDRPSQRPASPCPRGKGSRRSRRGGQAVLVAGRIRGYRFEYPGRAVIRR